jgi:hypothetical protein
MVFGAIPQERDEHAEQRRIVCGSLDRLHKASQIAGDGRSRH